MSDKFDFYCEEALSGKTPIEKVYESDRVLAFFHTKPSYKKHIVIVPRKHIKDLVSLEDAIWISLGRFSLSQEI